MTLRSATSILRDKDEYDEEKVAEVGEGAGIGDEIERLKSEVGGIRLEVRRQLMLIKRRQRAFEDALTEVLAEKLEELTEKLTSIEEKINLILEKLG